MINQQTNTSPPTSPPSAPPPQRPPTSTSLAIVPPAVPPPSPRPSSFRLRARSLSDDYSGLTAKVKYKIMGKRWSDEHPAPSYTVFHVMPKETLGYHRGSKASKLYKTTYTTLLLSDQGKKVASYKQMLMWTLPNAPDRAGDAADAAATWRTRDEGGGNVVAIAGGDGSERGSRGNNNQQPLDGRNNNYGYAGPPLRSPRRVRRSEDLRDATR